MTKKVATGKTSDALRKLREKNSGKAKKQPAPAKPKQQPKKKVAAKPKEEPQFISGGSLVELKAEANKAIPAIKEGVKGIMSNAVSLDQKLQDARERELWKYCDTPYKSWTAFVGELRTIAGKSAATLFGMIGLQKALPGSTAEERRQIGPRKGAKVAAAAKVAASKGVTLPPEIVETAKTGTEEDLVSEIEARNLAPEKPAEDKRTSFDPLMFDPEKNTFPENPRNGGSGKVEGQSESAQQFSGVVKEAIDAFIAISHNPNVPDFEPDEALKGICAQWLRCECVESDYGDMTNRQAADEIGRTQKKNGKAAHA